MDLDAYERATEQHCGELQKEIESYGLDRLQALCGQMGGDNFRSHIDANAPLMAEYIRRTPSERKKLHRYLPEGERAIFVLGCLYLARCGHALLQQVCQCGLTAGPSYRMISGQAAQASKRLRDDWPTLWPYEDVEDPFHEV